MSEVPRYRLAPALPTMWQTKSPPCAGATRFFSQGWFTKYQRLRAWNGVRWGGRAGLDSALRHPKLRKCMGAHHLEIQGSLARKKPRPPRTLQ